MAELAILLVVVPLTGAAICLVLQPLRRPALSRSVSLLALLAVLALLAASRNTVADPPRYPVGGWSAPLGIELRLDGIAWLGSLLGAIVGIASLLAAGREERRQASFYFLFLMLVTGLQAALLTTDVFNLFVAVEIISLATYLLIASEGTGTAHQASLWYLLLSSLGMALYLLGVLLAYQQVGNLSMEALAAAASSAHAAQRFRVRLAAGAMATGVGLKAALVPLHTWLPAAHAAAPHPVSSMLSGAMVKVSFLLAVRLLALAAWPSTERLLLWVGAIGAALGVLFALAQTDAKRLLAYHSISQIGYVVAAWGAATAIGRTAALYHASSHALFKSLLFLVVGAAIEASGERSIARIRLPRAAAWRLGPPFAVGALAITGMPPTNGHVSKTLVFAALKDEPAYWLLVAAGAGTVASFLKLAGIFAHTHRDSPCGRLGAGKTVALAGLALLCLASGIAPAFWAARLAELGAAFGTGAFAAGYAPADLGSSTLALLAGGLLFALTRSRAGKTALEAVRLAEPGLDGSLALVLAAFVGLAAGAWLEASPLIP